MNKKLRNLFAMLLAVVVAATQFVGCNATQSPIAEKAPAGEAQSSAVDESTEGAEAIKVGFGLYFRNDEWWKDLESESVKKAGELGIE